MASPPKAYTGPATAGAETGAVSWANGAAAGAKKLRSPEARPSSAACLRPGIAEGSRAGREQQFEPIYLRMLTGVDFFTEGIE